MANLRKSMLVVSLLMMALCGVSMAAVYQVGDSAGWTSMGQVDYQDWAASKNFHVGDTLVFNYNNQFHNVKQVAHPGFESCNATSPIATYTNGSDTVALEKLGHFYFICGYPGHCQAGQKIDILVAPATSKPNHAASPSTSSASSLYSINLYAAIRGNKAVGIEICGQLASNGIVVILIARNVTTARDEKRGLRAIDTLKRSDLCLCGLLTA
ncbi:hypothetical protein DKX38_002951 [Salix brachista]|uniref:Phytocyanin domain-containing protein n=1 Tax=Salix brachista TaxID=2182728 RepID=A0A5N5NQC3_9ROSI|nr:hypothetical protein DKX38_002951 [Salix brachista]